MLNYIKQTIAQIEARLVRLEQDKPYFTGALDALKLVEEEYIRNAKQIEHNKSSGPQTAEAETAEPK